MKKNKTIIWLLLAATLLVCAGCGNSTGSGEETHSENVTDHSQNTDTGTESVSEGKTLIVYYSYSGTTYDRAGGRAFTETDKCRFI